MCTSSVKCKGAVTARAEHMGGIVEAIEAQGLTVVPGSAGPAAPAPACRSRRLSRLMRLSESLLLRPWLPVSEPLSVTLLGGVSVTLSMTSASVVDSVGSRSCSSMLARISLAAFVRRAASWSMSGCAGAASSSAVAAGTMHGRLQLPQESWCMLPQSVLRVQWCWCWTPCPDLLAARTAIESPRCCC